MIHRAKGTINIDTEQPLALTEVAQAVDIPEYYTNWMRPTAAAR